MGKRPAPRERAPEPGMRPIHRALALLLIALLGAVAAAQERPSRSDGYPAPARGRHGMVASASDLASRVGVDVLKRGGNAVDAAVAVGLALAVTSPGAGNLGGGGFMLIRLADGQAAAVDYRETAPAAARREMYLDRERQVIPGASTVGPLAVGVPGTVAGFALALEKYGTMRWRDVVEPARKLAADGFPVSHHLARSLRASEVLSRFPESRRIFLRDGKPYEEGERFRQPDLARTLRRLQEDGPREFYEGRTARLIADEMRRSGGILTQEDLKAYRAVEREPVRGTYRGHELVTMPPPSSGGTILVEMLNMLERHDLSRMGQDSSRKDHLMLETMRRAFADRAEFMGDPDFVRVPVAGLTSKQYAAERASTIDAERATPSARVGHGQPPGREGTQTTHYSVVDAEGNAVANTYTINGWYGSGLTVRGAGFLLNNEMDDFTSAPGKPNQFGLIQGEANAIAPGKRPLSSMTPTVVLKGGRLFLVTGSPGGPTIINTVLQNVLNVVDHGMNVQQAVAAPRLHHQWMPDMVRWEPFGLAPDVKEALEARGHRFSAQPAYIGDAQAVMVDPESGVRLGGADPRNPDGAAIGY